MRRRPRRSRLRPAAGESAATATRFELCIESDQRMHRIAVAVRPPPGTLASQLRLEGCNPTPNGSGVRACSLGAGSVGPTVNESVSFTMGPLATPPAGMLPDAMYVVLEGSVPAPGAFTLNPNITQEWCLGVISIDAPPGVPGEPPDTTALQGGPLAGRKLHAHADWGQPGRVRRARRRGRR